MKAPIIIPYAASSCYTSSWSIAVYIMIRKVRTNKIDTALKIFLYYNIPLLSFSRFLEYMI